MGNRLSQSLSKIYLHAIFSTKERYPLLADDWRNELFAVMASALKHKQCHPVLIGGVRDHVHALFDLNRTCAPADAIREMKVLGTKWINDNQKCSARFEWQSGYAVFSVSGSVVQSTINYIANQEEHRSRISFQDELRIWLRRYDIKWDEEYLFDSD